MTTKVPARNIPTKNGVGFAMSGDMPTTVLPSRYDVGSVIPGNMLETVSSPPRQSSGLVRGSFIAVALVGAVVYGAQEAPPVNPHLLDSDQKTKSIELNPIRLGPLF